MKFTSREINTIPNYLTAARALAIPKLYKMVRDNPGRNWWIAGAFAATDNLDGMLARLEDKSPALGNAGFRRSEVGRKLDPTVDKVFGATMLVAGMKSGAIPGWLGGISLAQKAATTAVTLNAERQGIELHVSQIGKYGEFVTTAGLGLMLGAEGIENPTLKAAAKVGAGTIALAGIGMASTATIGYAQESGLVPELSD